MMILSGLISLTSQTNESLTPADWGQSGVNNDEHSHWIQLQIVLHFLEFIFWDPQFLKSIQMYMTNWNGYRPVAFKSRDNLFHRNYAVLLSVQVASGKGREGRHSREEWPHLVITLTQQALSSCSLGRYSDSTFIPSGHRNSSKSEEKHYCPGRILADWDTNWFGSIVTSAFQSTLSTVKFRLIDSW